MALTFHCRFDSGPPTCAHAAWDADSSSHGIPRSSPSVPPRHSRRERCLACVEMHVVPPLSGCYAQFSRQDTMCGQVSSCRGCLCPVGLYVFTRMPLRVFSRYLVQLLKTLFHVDYFGSNDKGTRWESRGRVELPRGLNWHLFCHCCFPLRVPRLRVTLNEGMHLLCASNLTRAASMFPVRVIYFLLQ